MRSDYPIVPAMASLRPPYLDAYWKVMRSPVIGLLRVWPLYAIHVLLCAVLYRIPPYGGALRDEAIVAEHCLRRRLLARIAIALVGRGS
jgi:hypothetical protein